MDRLWTKKLLGKRIGGKYRVESVIGAGAAATVFLATHEQVERTVAIKILHPIEEQGMIARRFEIEAKAVAKLNHPKCIRLWDYAYSEELKAYYMVMEHVPGEDLADYMTTKAMTVDFVMSIAYDIAEALTHAHDLGVMHRDLKPENVIITEGPHGDKIGKVVDFGLARILAESRAPSGPGRSPRVTLSGDLFGTPYYMAPEQCRGALHATKAVDWYALGIMLFELFEGFVPFHSEALADIMVMHIVEPMPPQKSKRSPPALKKLIEELTLKDASERLSDGHEILDRLGAFVPHEHSMEFPSSWVAAAEARLKAEREKKTAKPKRKPPPIPKEALTASVAPHPERKRRNSSFHGALVDLFESEFDDGG